jgi:hypothetical protein
MMFRACIKTKDLYSNFNGNNSDANYNSNDNDKIKNQNEEKVIAPTLGTYIHTSLYKYIYAYV